MKKQPRYGEQFRTRRNALGLSLEKVARQVSALLPGDEDVTSETLRKYEVGDVQEQDADIVILAAYVEALGVAPSDISPGVARRTEEARELFLRICSRCLAELTGDEGQDSQNCNDYASKVPEAA